MKSLLSNLHSLMGHRVVRLFVALLISVVLATSLTFGLRVVNANSVLAAGKHAVLATFFATQTVTNGNDSGSGSLRAAIDAASAGDTIVFSGVTTVILTSGELVINKNLTITGPGANQLTVQRSEVSGTSTFRIFNISSGSTLALAGMTISNGYGDEGGGIRNAGTLTITECAFTYNQSKGTDAGGPTGKTGGGGAIFNDATGVVTITRSTISSNKAIGGNGESGIGNAGGGGGGLGGGIFNQGGSVTVTNTTLSSNQAFGGAGGDNDSACTQGDGRKGGGQGGNSGQSGAFGGGGGGGASGGRFGGGGGGGAAGGFLGGQGLKTFSQPPTSCLTGSGGSGGAAGGAVFNYGGTLTLVNVTIVRNQVQSGSNLGFQSETPSSSRAGGIYNEAGTLTLQNSIVAGNTAQQSAYADCDFNSNAIITNGNNLFGSGTGCPTGGTGDLSITPANVFVTALGPLTNNGGSTLTHALLSGSPAINAGNNSVTSAPYSLSIDQRGTGFARNLGGTVDIGAYETSEPASNTAPTISPMNLSRTAGAGSSNSTIANVSDAQQAANTLTVKVNGATSATVNGVTVSGLSIGGDGVVTANVLAQLNAGSAEFVLAVTDSQGTTRTSALVVAVTLPTCGEPNWPHQGQSFATPGAASDFFGKAVAISGNTAIFGAPGDDTAGDGAGAAYVFTRSGTTWTLQQKLLSPAAAAGDNFGVSVALYGDTAIVGANLDDTLAGSDAGAAYVFTRSSGVWTLQQQLIALNGSAGDRFGASVALSGDTAIVGANAVVTSLDYRPGAAYVFVRSGTVWAEQQRLRPNHPNYGENFGNSVALSGDTAIIGANLDDVWGTNTGTAFIFTRSGNVWSVQKRLERSDTPDTHQFGLSVALSGGTALLASRVGTVYVYVWSGTDWVEQQQLTGSGLSVALSGDTAIIGAAGNDTAATDAGIARIYTRSGTVWTEQKQLFAPDAAAGDGFGGAVALYGSTALIGASADDTAVGADVGSAHVFTYNCAASTPPSITTQTGISRQQGSPVSNSTIATVSDANLAASNLTVTVTSANPANGVTLSNIVNTNGTITADIVMACDATNASFTLQVSNGSETATATLDVTATGNIAPTLTYGAVSVNAGNSTTNSPTAATDNGSIVSYAVQALSTYTGTISANASGVVSISNAAPVGSHTITIQATDNCGMTKDATFTLTVNCGSPVVTNGNDSGAGSLRQAIADACAGGTITFQAGATTVTLTSAELLINKNLTIDGGAAGVTITRSGATQFRIFNISSGTVALKKLTITNGNTTSQAGGIQNSGTLTLTDCAVTGNTSPQGGGIQNDGALTMTNCTVSGNTSSGSGGGFAMFGSTATLTNCTVSGNTASGGGGGFSISSGTLSLTNCTVANNTAQDGGALNLSGSTHVLKNTIVAGNTATSTSSENIVGAVNPTSSYNLIGVGGTGGLTNGVNGNQVGVPNPLLNSLANNGGYTQTISLQLGSPALDKGAAVSGLTTDQRGQTRPFDIGNITAASGGDHSDIGAFEVNPTCNTVTVSPPSLPNGTDGVSYTQTLTASGGDSAYTFTVTSGSLPTGLILQSNGTLSGMPSAAGTFNFTVTAYYGFGCAGSQAYSLTIASCGANTSYTVNDLGDAADASPGNGVCATSGGVCTLRAAIQEINALPACANTINFSVTGTIQLGSALPDLAANYTINGPGANQLTVRRNSGSYRIFNIPSNGGLTLSGLTISNGLGDEGGAIRNTARLTVTDCAFTGNASKGTNAGGTAGKTGGGGAIFNDATGTVTITRSIFNGNTATGGNGETFTSNGGGGGGGGLGGAIFNNGGTVTVTNTTLSSNSAVGGAGGNG